MVEMYSWALQAAAHDRFSLPGIGDVEQEGAVLFDVHCERLGVDGHVRKDDLPARGSE